MDIIIAVVPIIAACVSVWFAIVSARAAKKSLVLSEQQEVRRQPVLKPYLISGYFKKFIQDDKIYAFSISVSNATDTDNAIVLLELEVCYVSAQNNCMKVKVPHEVDLVKDFGGGEIKPFILPTSVLSHQAVAGWALFNVSGALLDKGALDSYRIVLTDSHGIVTVFDPGIPKEIKNV